MKRQEKKDRNIHLKSHFNEQQKLYFIFYQNCWECNVNKIGYILAGFMALIPYERGQCMEKGSTEKREEAGETKTG